MKAYAIALLFFISIVASTYPQTYTPFPTSNAVWRVRASWNTSSQVTTYFDKQLMITGEDTILDSKTYKKIMLRERSTSINQNDPAPSYENLAADNPDVFYMGLREEDKRIYIYGTKYNYKDKQIYDFNLKVGEKVPEFYTGYAGYVPKQDDTIKSIDTKVFLDQQTGTVFHLYRAHLMEGIGSSSGLLEEAVTPLNSILICFQKDGNTVYQRDGYTECGYIAEAPKSTLSFGKSSDQLDIVNVYPNPSRSTVKVQMLNNTSGSFTINILNSTGVTIYSIGNGLNELEVPEEVFTANGLYIVNIYMNDKVYSKKVAIQK